MLVGRSHSKMTTIEETGKDVEEATEKALEQLGVTEDQVDVEILEEGSKGFLGIGQALARVRVTVREMPAGEAKPRPAPTRPAQGRRKPAPKREARPPKPEVKPAPAPKAEAEPEQMATGEAIQQAAEVGKEVLGKILEGIDSEGKVVVRTASDSQIVLDIVGGDTARIIGRHGQTIDSIQYLVGIIVNRKIGAKARVLVDAEGYRERREETLRKQALALAKKVKETGQEAVLESLHSNERRVIHTALVDNPDVYTYSEGEEPNRFLVISPKK
jgi:spoIIIJ-associated protein